MQEIIVVLGILSFLSFVAYKIVQRFRSRIRRRRQMLAQKGWSLDPLFIYPDGTKALGPSNHFHGHEGSKVMFVSSKWKILPRYKWLFDKIWNEEEGSIKKVRKDGKFAIVDDQGNLISSFYLGVKISTREVKAWSGKRMISLAVLINESGKYITKEISEACSGE